MQVSFSGWRRRCGDHVLIRDREISRAEPFESAEILSASGTYIEAFSGGVIVYSQASDVSLNGDYLVSILLTKDDVASLLTAVWSAEPFGEVINHLSKVCARKKSGGASTAAS